MVTISENYLAQYPFPFVIAEAPITCLLESIPSVRYFSISQLCVYVCVCFQSGFLSSMNRTYNVDVFHLSGNPINRDRLVNVCIKRDSAVSHVIFVVMLD